MIVCITGDIDYFDTESFECLDSYFSVLDSCKVTGTFFITAKAAEEYPDRVEYITKQGHVVEGHGDVHLAFYDSVPVQTGAHDTYEKNLFNPFRSRHKRIQGSVLPAQ